MGQDGVDLSTTTNLAPNTSDTSTGFYQSYNNYYGLYYIDHSNSSPLNTTLTLNGDYYFSPLEYQSNNTYDTIYGVYLEHNSTPLTTTITGSKSTIYFDSLKSDARISGFEDSSENSSFLLSNINFNFKSLEGMEVYGISLADFSLTSSQILFEKIIASKEVLAIRDYRGKNVRNLTQSHIVFSNIQGDFITGISNSSGINDIVYNIDNQSDISFNSIQSTSSSTGYSLYTPMTIQGGGKIHFHSISSQIASYGIQAGAGGIAFDNQSNIIFDLIQGKASTGIHNIDSVYFKGNGYIEFKSIQSSSLSYGIFSSTQTIFNNFQTTNNVLVFDLIQSAIASYGIYNDGHAIYDFGDNGVSFKSIIGGKLRAVGVYNNQGLMEISGSVTFKSITNSFGGVYGIQNNGDILLADGSSLTFGSPSSGISDYKIFEGLGSTLELGNMVLSSSKDTTIGIKATDTTTMLLQANKTLNFDLKSTAKEGVAFDGGNLILSSQSQVIFNSNGGNLTSLSGNDGKILLSGTSTTNRLQPNSRLLLRSLEIANMDINNSTFVLYADKSANIDTTNGFDGRAYDENKTHTSQGGSDRIIISGSTLYTPTYNTLKIALPNFSEARTYVVLAEVDASVKDTVIFNGLAKSGDKANTKSYAGFETQTLEIERYDGADKTYYFSHLASPNQAVINSDYSKSTISATQTNFSLLSANLNSLNKRMGDLRNQVNQHGVWTRIFLGSQSYDFGLGTQDQGFYWTIQAGYDYAFALSDSTNYLGFALSYLNSNTTQDLYSLQFSKNVSNSVMTNGAELAIYNSYISDQGFYSDSILKFSYLSSELDFFNQNTSYKLDNYALTLSEEIGYAIKLGTSKEWIITPQLEVAYSYFDSTDLSQTLASGHTMQVHQNSISLLRNRAGFDWRYDFSHLSKNILASLYVGTYYVYDVLDGGRITLKTINDFQSYQALKSEGRIMLNLGTNINLYEHTSLYFDFEKSFLGKQIQTDYQVNLGVRYSFGEKIKNFIEVEETENKDVTKAPLRIEEKTQDSSKEKNKVQE